MLRKSGFFSGFLAFSLILTTGCGDKQPPPATAPGTSSSLTSGLTPITPIEGGMTGTDGVTSNNGTTAGNGSSNFNPNDDFEPNTNPVTPDNGSTDPVADSNPNPSETISPSEDPAASPTPAPTEPDTPSPEPSTQPTPDPTATPTEVPSPTPTPTVEPSATPTPSPTPTATPTPSPTPTPAPYGNEPLGFLSVGVMDQPDGIDVKNGRVYITHYQAGGTFSNYKRLIRDFQLTNGVYTDIAVLNTFSQQTNNGAVVYLNGVAVNGGVIWSITNVPTSEGFNLYKHNTAGQLMQRYKVAQNATNSTILNDIAVDTSSGVVYLASPTTFSIIKYDDVTPSNTQLLFSGATNINPVGLALDANGHVYATDAGTGKVIKFSKSDGSRLLEFDGKGTNGQGELFSAIGDLAVDPRNGDIYVAAVASGKVKIFRYDASGQFIHSFSHADLSAPKKMAIGNDGVLHVVDGAKKAVLAFAPGKMP